MKKKYNKTGRPSVVSCSDISILKSILYKNSNLSETQIHKEWNLQIGKTLSLSTCRRNLIKLKLSCGFANAVKDGKYDVDLEDAKPSFTIFSIAGHRDQFKRKSLTHQHSQYTSQQLDDKVELSSSPLNLPSNFCEIQLENSSSCHQPVQYDDINQSQLSESSSSMLEGLKDDNTQSICMESKLRPSNTAHNLNNRHRMEKFRRDAESRENFECNLKTFGNFIDAELEKLDKNSLAVAKMKIHEVLQNAAMGAYRNVDVKIYNESVEESDDINDDQQTHLSLSLSSNRKRHNQNSNHMETDKENRISSSSPYSPSSENQNLNQTDPDAQQGNRFKKKRPKSKEILSAVYDALQMEIGDQRKRSASGEQATISFGTYICNELKTMDNETAKKTKIEICRVIYKASIGKYKNLTNENYDNYNNTHRLNSSTQTENCSNVRTIDSEISIETDLEMMVTPKLEISDTSNEP